MGGSDRPGRSGFETQGHYKAAVRYLARWCVCKDTLAWGRKA